jgi:hypothetical protein
MASSQVLPCATGRSSRAGGGTPYIVAGAASERFDVPQFRVCSHRAAWQHGRSGERLRAADAAGGIGRRGQLADQRHTLRSRESQCAQRPQRHRQRVEDPAAWQKLATASCLRIRRFTTTTVTRGGALRGRVGAHLQRGLNNAAGPPARASTLQDVYGDLPGLLARAGLIPKSCVLRPSQRQ